MLRQSVRHFAKAASKSTSTAKKAVDFNEKSVCFTSSLLLS